MEPLVGTEGWRFRDFHMKEALASIGGEGFQATENLPSSDSDTLSYKVSDERRGSGCGGRRNRLADPVGLCQAAPWNITPQVCPVLVHRRGDLDHAAVVKRYLTTAADAKSYRIKHYKLAMILAMG